jgi:hypothetical protein
MATQAYRTWVAAGRPFSRPVWLTEIKALARAHGVPFLGDLGNEEHLQAANPLDHTPFSTTEWPIPINGYWINAIDLGDGPWSDRLLAECRAGRARWVKYLLFRGRSYSRRNNWVAGTSSDHHLHISGMSDHLHDSIGGYNPFVVPVPPAPVIEGDDMVLVHRTNPVEFAYVGETIRVITDQNDANALASVVGNSREIPAERFERLKQILPPASAVYGR